MNVNVELVKPEVLDKHLKALDIEPEGEVEARIKQLTEHYRSNRESIQFAQCDTCGGYSDIELDECPYCGDAEPVEGAEDGGEGAPAEAKPDNSDGDAAVAAVDAKIAAKDKPARKPRSKANGAAEGSKSKAAKAKPATKKKAATKANGVAKKKAATKAKPATKKKAATKAKAVNTEVVPADEAAEVFSVADLDAQCEIIRKSTRMAASELFHMGQAFARIQNDQLWKLRTGDEGKPAYSNFKRFVADEFGISHTYAYSLIDVASRFTEDQIKELGVSKLKLALSVPEDRQGEMVDAASNGATVDDLKTKAREIREGTAGGEEAEAPEPVEAKRGVTVAFVAGPHIVPAYKRPTKPGKVGKLTERASALADEPCGVLELENDVTVHIRTTVDANGEIEFIVEAKRGKGTV